MKIAMFTDCYLDLTGGIITSMSAEKSALENLGHTVYLFSTAYPKSDSEVQKLASQNIFVVPSCKYWLHGITPLSKNPKTIQKWILKNHPEIKDFDVFHSHYEAGCSIAGINLAHKLNIPVVQTMHGREDVGVMNIIPRGFRTIVAVFLNILHAFFLPHKIKIRPDNYLAQTLAAAKMWSLMVNHANAADLIISPSEHFRKKLQFYGVYKDIKVIPNGIADDLFPASVATKSYDGTRPLKIIWHSRVSREKRIMPFLRALLQVQGNYELDVYGSGGDLALAKSFCRLHRLNVKFHGKMKFEKLQTKIAEADLDVLVSYNFDTFGMTLIEAEAAGVPVLICDPDLAEIIPKGSFLLAESPTSADLAAALNQIFEHPEKIEKMSRIMIINREKIKESKIVERLLAVFHN